MEHRKGLLENTNEVQLDSLDLMLFLGLFDIVSTVASLLLCALSILGY